MLNRVHECRLLRADAVLSLTRGILGSVFGFSLLWAGGGYALELQTELIPDVALVSKTEAMKQMNQQFAAGVIIPGYESLVGQMDELVQSAQAFEAEPTEDTLSAVRRAWLGAAASWATSNAVAFGPVHSLGYSASLESPADTAALDTLLTYSAEIEEFDVKALLPSLQGFEAMAYILDIEGDKAAADFSAQELRYLSALTVRAHAVSDSLLDVWQVGWNDNPAYETLLSTAGQPGNPAYLSVESGSEEIVRSIINSLDVVAAEELPDILDALASTSEAPDDVTLRLLTSNLQGIQSAYLGTVSEDRTVVNAAGVSGLVAIANTDLNQQIQTSLDVALDGMEQAMAEPADTQALAMAQSSLETAFTLLETEVLPLVQR